MSSRNWRRNLLFLWLSQTLIMMAFSFFFPFIPLYVQTLGVHGDADAARWAGLITAAAAVSMAVVQPIWGNLADRFGRKPMVVRSMLAGSIITTLMGMATSPEQLLLLRFIQGAFTGTIAAANALVAASTPRSRLGYALGVMQMSFFLGASVGPLGGGLIADHFGFRMSFYVAGVLMLVGCLIVTLLVHEDFERPPAGVVRPGVWGQSRALLALSGFPILIAITFLIQLGGVIVSPVLSLFIADLSNDQNAASAAGLVLGATGAASAVSALTLGRFSDRVGPKVILPICLLGAAITYIPQAYVSDVTQLLVLRVLLGGFLGGLLPSTNALVAAIVSPDRRGAAFGLTATASALANAVGPLSGAGIAAQLGIRAVFVGTGVLYAGAFTWMLLAVRGREFGKSKQVAATSGPVPLPLSAEADRPTKK